MFQECPHCHTQVLPNPDGRCPACRKFFSDISDISPGLKKFDIKSRSSLPPICIYCGNATERTVVLEEGIQKGGDSWLDKLFLSRAPQLIKHGEVLAIELAIPQCKECAKTKGKPKPERVNFEDGSMTFLVHINFYDGVVGRHSEKLGSYQSDPSFQMKVDGVYSIRNIGLSVTGQVERGVLHIDDEIRVSGKDLAKKIIIGGILANHKQVDQANPGMKIEIQLPKLEKDDIKRGDILTG